MHKSLSLVLIAVIAGCGAKQTPNETVSIDNYTANRITSIIESKVETASYSNVNDAIANISAEFLGTPYEANVLIGSPTQPEQLVIDFRGLDCFTYLWIMLKPCENQEARRSLCSKLSEQDMLMRMSATCTESIFLLTGHN